MFTRRGFVHGALGAGAGFALTVPQARWADAKTDASQTQRNKSVVRRFMEAQGSKDEAAVMREVLAPDFKWSRLATQHFDDQARFQGFPSTGPHLHTAFPDYAYRQMEFVAEGGTVNLTYCARGTHQANFNGIPATGRKLDTVNVAMFQLAGGKITDAWIMNDEFAMLEQLGTKLSTGLDGELLAPPLSGAGEKADVVIDRLAAGPLASREDRNRLLIARTKGSPPFPNESYAPDFEQTRFGFKHLRSYGDKTGTASQNLGSALSDRRDHIEYLIAEGDQVWMRFNLVGIHTKPLYGLPPTGRRVEVSEVAVMHVVDGKWKQAWYYADELGLMLQLGIVNDVLDVQA